jgi:hypothetical protein
MCLETFSVALAFILTATISIISAIFRAMCLETFKSRVGLHIDCQNT